MEKLRAGDERMTPAEAESVLARFRQEEEVRQLELEAAASNPTVLDLAEGLGIEPERVSRLLAQVRAEQPPTTPQMTATAAHEEVQRQNRSAWAIAAIVLVAAFVLMAFVVMFFSTTTVERAATPYPPPMEEAPALETAPPVETPRPTH
jgi:hypothetical protein